MKETQLSHAHRQDSAAALSALTDLIKSGAMAPSADNSQPCRFEWNGTSLAVSFREGAIGNSLFGAGDHPVLMSAGAVLENLTGYLKSVPISHRLAPAADARSGAPYFRLDIDPGIATREGSGSVFGIDRHTNRFPFANRAVPAELVGGVAQATEGSARCIVLDQRAAIARLAAIATTCSEARFCNRRLHEWLMDSLRHSPEEAAAGDGLDVATLYLPPGGRTFLKLTSDWRTASLLNRFGAYRFSAKADSALLRKAPVAFCIAGSSDPDGILAAGRLLERTWIELNSKGLAVHPYYVITDQQQRLLSGDLPNGWAQRVEEAVSTLPSLLGFSGSEMLHMVLRVGWPGRNPPRSRRLPIEMVFRDLTSSGQRSKST